MAPVKLNARPMKRDTEISTSSGKNRKPAAVRRTSFMVPAMFIAIGPQIVTVNKIFMVMTKPKHPENKSMALSPYISAAGSKNTCFKT